MIYFFTSLYANFLANLSYSKTSSIDLGFPLLDKLVTVSTMEKISVNFIFSFKKVFKQIEK